MRESNEKHREQLRVRDKEYQDKMGETESVIISKNLQIKPLICWHLLLVSFETVFETFWYS